MVVLDSFFPWSSVLNLRTSPELMRKNPVIMYGARRGQNASGAAGVGENGSGPAGPHGSIGMIPRRKA